MNNPEYCESDGKIHSSLNFKIKNHVISCFLKQDKHINPLG